MTADVTSQLREMRARKRRAEADLARIREAADEVITKRNKAIVAAHAAGLSTREIGALFDRSHTWVGNILKSVSDPAA